MPSSVLNESGVNKMNPMKEIQISVRINGSMRRISTWRFFPALEFCFRLNGMNWEGIEYTRGMKMCERIINAAKTDTSIYLDGTMMNELRSDEHFMDQITKLGDGEKLVLGEILLR